MLQQRRKGCVLEQEKKKSPHFLRWPWNVVIYILLFVALRLFALPIVLIIMGIQKKNNPHGVAEGYCLSRTRKRLPEFLIALLLLFFSVALGALFFYEIRQPKDDWEMMDYITLIIAGGGSLLMGIAFGLRKVVIAALKRLSTSTSCNVRFVFMPVCVWC